VPASALILKRREGEMTVMIGVDPHKRSHTAVMIDDDDVAVSSIEVRAGAGQLDELFAWSAGSSDRVWAIESANGLGYLLAQQLVAAGERVLDVPPTLAARVRVLANGRSNKNDPNDALSVAIAARHAARITCVQSADHAVVLRLLVKRHRDLGRLRNRTACRLHALLCELAPGGIAGEITPNKAQRLLDDLELTTAVHRVRHDLAADHVADLRHIDAQMRASKQRITDAVAASGTTLTDIFGVGPVVAAMILGHTRNVSRFANRDRYAAYCGTAPIEVASGGRSIHRLSLRGNRQLNHAMHIVAVTQIRHRHSPGRAFYDRKIAEGKTSKEAVRALKRRITGIVFAHLRAEQANRGPGGQAGTTANSSVAGLTPQQPALRKNHSRTTPNATTRRRHTPRTGNSRRSRR
jgi:transposase